MSEEKPSEFVDIPPCAFPFTMQLLNRNTREVLWETTVNEPGAINIPGRATFGLADGDVLARVITSDGQEIWG